MTRVGSGPVRVTDDLKWTAARDIRAATESEIIINGKGDGPESDCEEIAAAVRTSKGEKIEIVKQRRPWKWTDAKISITHIGHAMAPALLRSSTCDFPRRAVIPCPRN